MRNSSPATTMRNELIKAATAAALVSVVAMPFAAFAQSDAATTHRAQAQARDVTAAADRADAACTRLVETAHRATSQWEARRTQVDGDRARRDEERAGRRTTQRDAVASRVAEHDAKLGTRFQAMIDKAGDSDRKAALIAFQQAVQAAVSARRTAYADAHDAYLEGIDAALAAHRSAVDAAGADLRAAIEAAVAQVETDCGSGADAAQVRAAFRTALNDARTAFRAAISAAPTAGDAQKDLRDVRDAAYADARTAFQNALGAAKDALRTALEALPPANDGAADQGTATESADQGSGTDEGETAQDAQ